MQQSLPLGPGVGYRVQAQPGGAGTSSAIFEAQGQLGRVEVRGDRVGGQFTSGVTVSGAVALLDRAIHLSRPIHDAFALVRVGGVSGVRTYLSNQYIGRTNRRGTVLVPGLASYYSNRLRVDERDVPFDRDISRTEWLVAPAPRSGGVVSFPVRVIRLVSGVFDLPASSGPAVPADAEVDWPDGTESVALDDDNRFFLERAAPGRHLAWVTRGTQLFRCVVVVGREPDAPLGIDDVGRVGCAAAPRSERRR
jgi:outer membrane usher protein